MTRDYESAIVLLNSRKAQPKPRIDDMRGSDDMLDWMKLLGHSAESMRDISIIHVAGTNGKGSTCAYVESLLKTYSERTGFQGKIGLYASPHLTCIRERIRLNCQKISEEEFTARFYEVWDKLPAVASPALDIPRYLQLLALIAFHTFIEEKVSVAIVETHSGGEYDATNIVSNPIATGVTSISLDHVQLFGPTIENIAWHKGGIFKAGSSTFSSPQAGQVESVLRRRAAERGTNLKVIDPQRLTWPISAAKPEVQKLNCSLAIALSNTFLVQKRDDELSAKDIASGIARFQLPGRFQQFSVGNIHWFLDGAHNESGVDRAARWYAESILPESSQNTKVLVFSHFSERDGVALLSALASVLHECDVKPHHVILSSYDERRDGQERIDKNKRNRFSPEKQRCYMHFWRKFDPEAHISLTNTIEEALEMTKSFSSQVQSVDALITGSLQLVGGSLYLLHDR